MEEQVARIDTSSASVETIDVPVENGFWVEAAVGNIGRRVDLGNANGAVPQVTVVDVDDTGATTVIDNHSPGRATSPTALAVARDGSRLYAVYADREGEILDAATLAAVGKLPCPAVDEACLAVGLDGRLLVAGSDRTCTLITPAANATPLTIRLPAPPVAAVAAARNQAA
ncbi:hypothetical protein [Streptomyces sp. NRRL B-1347]|uniref:hypothetical protein n=1 Tax=Streptomyces sp. NRRL B-1347 TaxID=1476877 RepID=UPI00131E366A|nr:hypothetical protein [Streptomyces sp. NRRL B-1347]